MQQPLRKGQNIGEITVLDKRVSRNHRNTLLPKQSTVRQAIKVFSGFIFQIFPHNARGRQVYQIPIIDTVRLRQIEIINKFSVLVIAFPEALYQHQQSAKPTLVPLTLQQLRHHIKRSVLVLFCHRTGIRNHYTQKFIPLTVLPLSRLEKTGKIFSFHRIGIRLQFSPDICNSNRYFFR